MSSSAHLAKLSAKRSSRLAQRPSLPVLAAPVRQGSRRRARRRRRRSAARGRPRGRARAAPSARRRALRSAGRRGRGRPSRGSPARRPRSGRWRPAPLSVRCGRHQPVDEGDQAAGLRARGGDGGEERLAVGGRHGRIEAKVARRTSCGRQPRAAALRARRVQAIARAGDVGTHRRRARSATAPRRTATAAPGARAAARRDGARATSGVRLGSVVHRACLSATWRSRVSSRWSSRARRSASRGRSRARDMLPGRDLLRATSPRPRRCCHTTRSRRRSRRARSAGSSTLSADGAVNLAPYSFFNAVCGAPPMIAFSSEGMKDSAASRIETREFVWNMPTWDLREAMNDDLGVARRAARTSSTTPAWRWRRRGS